MNVDRMRIIGELSGLRRSGARAGLMLLVLAGPMPMAVAQDQPGGETGLDPVPAADGDQPSGARARCEASAAVEYEQRNTIARVEGLIQNQSCAASSGDYTIVISVKDENGEPKTLEFSETWQRSDDQPVKFLSDYKIGEGVELVRVRSRRLTCMCAGSSGD